MALYTALIAAWNGGTQPPAGVTGSPLLGPDTTAQKIAKVNAWTVTGVVPTSLYATGNQVLNCINYAEFKTLTATQQANLLMLLANDGPLLGGSANSAFLVDGMILDYFSYHSGPTVLALTALAQAAVTPWWQTSVANGGGGLNSPINIYDTQVAGLV